VAATSAFAARSDPAGDKAMHDYVLTMPKVKAYGAATEALAAAIKKDAALADEAEKSSDEPDQTLEQLRAKLDRHPKLFAFYAQEGLSKDDVVLLPLTLINGVSVVEYPQLEEKMKAVVSPDQIAFCKAHLEELKKMKFLQGDAAG
jgi:sirohydrochlorin ferrochelatase